MSDPEYRFRLSLIQKERVYRLSGDAILRDGGDAMKFADIRKIRIYDSPGWNNMAGGQVSPGFRRCVIRPAQGRPIVLSSNHFAGFGRFEDRRESFDPFVEALVQRVAAANPAALFIGGMPIALWLFWLVAVAGVMIVTPLAILLIGIELFDGGHIDAPLVLVTFLMAGLFFGFFPLARSLRRNRPRRIDPRNGGWP